MNEDEIKLNVYFNETLCGNLSKISNNEPNSEEYIFEYDQDYLESEKAISISFNFPLKQEKFTNKYKMHPYFDNLIAEGWLREKQFEHFSNTSKNLVLKDKFTLISYFGFDLIGSISIHNCNNNKNNNKPGFTYNETIIESNSNISGVQKKLLVKQTNNNSFQITKSNEVSTHIAKL